MILKACSYATLSTVTLFTVITATNVFNYYSGMPYIIGQLQGDVIKPPVFASDPDLDKEIRPSSAVVNNGTFHLQQGAFCRRSFDQRSGYCVPAHQCLQAVQNYRNHGIKVDVCTYEGNVPVVCCPLVDKRKGGKYARISVQKCREYNKLLQNVNFDERQVFSGRRCVASVPLIVGGQKTQTDEHPHMVALGWSQEDEIKWLCGGSLISESFVLSAAHCMVSNENYPDIVRLGAHNLYKSNSEQQDIKIRAVTLHPKYKTSSYYHDIALIKLDKNVTFSRFVQPACLWQLPQSNVPHVIATGWGRTKFGGAASAELMKVELNVVSQHFCRNFYGKERRLANGLSKNQLCAGYMAGGKDTCQGDSGGPLLVQLPEFNCAKFIMGITSFGKYCGAKRSPGVYTKVSAYLNWIENIVFPK